MLRNGPGGLRFMPSSLLALAMVVAPACADITRRPPLPKNPAGLSGRTTSPGETDPTPRPSLRTFARACSQRDRYFIWPSPRPPGRATLRLIVQAGSAHEREDERGFAHFVEHLAFGGTRLLPQAWISDFQRKTGVPGPDSNAFTAKESTRYHLDVPARDPAMLRQALLLLQQFSSEVTFAPATVDRLRPAVIEEERQQGAASRLEDQISALAYRGSPYALPVLGNMATIREATTERLRDFYRRWYRPELMAVLVVGDVDPAAIETEVRRLWGGRRPRRPGPHRCPGCPTSPKPASSSCATRG